MSEFYQEIPRLFQQHLKQVKPLSPLDISSYHKPTIPSYDKPIHPSEMPRISTCTDMITDDTNVPTKDDKYPWLDPDDKRRLKLLRLKLNLEDSLLDDKGKEEFLRTTDDFHDV